jgi:hypothetical protein
MVSHPKGRWTDVFGCKREEVTGGWRKVHNEKFNNMYSSPNINRVIKSRRGWVRHAACMAQF